MEKRRENRETLCVKFPYSYQVKALFNTEHKIEIAAFISH